MTKDEFAALVERLDLIARQNPSRYEARVVLLALLGYLYLAMVILLLLGLLGGSLFAVFTAHVIALKLVFIVAPFLWLVFKALWVKFPKPEGVEIMVEYAPDLFSMIWKLRRELRCVRFHHVLITNEFNAGVAQTPRLGPFGWYRNYLLIGLPLMKALTPAQLEAVLAHEFGHLAGGHGVISNRIYRLRMSWVSLLEALRRQNSAGMVLFQPFFNWFSPYFSAYSFPLARANEYHADAVAAQLCGAKVAAQALTNVEVMGTYLGARFWPDIHKHAEVTAHPAFAPHQLMSSRFSDAALVGDAPGWIEQALKQTTSVDNTHPAFADRLAALGQSPEFVLPQSDAAADSLLGPSRQRITDLHDEDWKRAIEPSWQARHNFILESREKLAAFETRERAHETLSVDDAFQYAMLIEDVGEGKDAAFPRLQALHELAPDNALVCFQLGMRLLARENDAGIALVEKCMTLDQEAVMPGCELLFNYCKTHGRDEEASRYQSAYEEKAGITRAILEEQETLKVSDRLEVHGLSPEVLNALQTQLRAISALRKVYLVKRLLKHQPEVSFFALGFVVVPWWKRHQSHLAEVVKQRIVAEVTLPGQTLVFCVDGDNAEFAERFRQVKGSRIL